MLLALAAGLLFFCCGCQKSADSTDSPPIAEAFTAQVSVVQGAFSCTAAVQKSADGTCITTMEEPAALSGLSITQSDDSCTFAFAGLTLQTPPALLPDAAFSACMREAFLTLTDSTRVVGARHDSNMVYNGRTQNGDTFTFTAESPSGTPLTLEFPGRQLTVTFTAYTAQSA